MPAVTALFAAQQPPPVSAPPKPAGSPMRHAQDDWLDQAPDKHRVVFDTWLADKFGGAAGYASNWIRYNKEAYGLTDGDLAVVLVARHGSTPFAFNEAAWAKYEDLRRPHVGRGPDRTSEPDNESLCRATRANVETVSPRRSVQRDLAGVHVEIIAKETGAEEADVRKELTANVIGNAVIVPAGILAVTRAQERGYAMVSIG